MQEIKFNIPYLSGSELSQLNEVVNRNHYKGDGFFNTACVELLKKKTAAESVLLTSSCTHALEMTALLMNIKEGDEVIMPSFTFSSTAH